MPVIDYIDSLANKPLDIHLMISKPERYIERFLDYNTKVLTVHLEASQHLHRTIEEIKSRGVMAGVAINPHTDVNHLSEIIKDLDLVCLMSVNPGFSGQKFIENSFSKVKKLKNLILTKKSKCEIQVDGGVNVKNAKELVKNGAGILVAGNYIFKSDNPHEKINSLKNLGLSFRSKVYWNVFIFFNFIFLKIARILIYFHSKHNLAFLHAQELK